MRNSKDEKYVIFGVVVLFAIAVFVSGCTNTGNTLPNETTEGTTEGTTTPTPTTEEGPAFTEVAISSSPEYKVNYDITYDYGGNEGTAKFTEYNKDDMIRRDYSVDNGGETYNARVYQKEETTSCVEMAGNWKCFSSSMQEFSGDTPAEEKATGQSEEVEKNPEDYDISYTGTRQIAGKTGHCYSVSDLESEATMEACYSNEGILLYFDGENEEGTATVEATSVSTDVSESDLELPAEPTDLSDLMSGISGVSTENLPV